MAVAAPGVAQRNSSGATPCDAMLRSYSAPTSSPPIIPTNDTSMLAGWPAAPSLLPLPLLPPLLQLPPALPPSRARLASPFITLAALPPGTLQGDGWP